MEERLEIEKSEEKIVKNVKKSVLRLGFFEAKIIFEEFQEGNPNVHIRNSIPRTIQDDLMVEIKF